MRKNSQDAVREFRPYFDNAPVYGHGPSLEDFTEQTPLTVGSPQEVIDKTLTFRESFGDYQRQLFLMDHAGLPLKTVLEQLDLLGEEVVPVLRKEFAARRAAGRGRGPHPRRPRRRRRTRRSSPERTDHDRHRRRLGRAQPAVVHPAAGRPPGRGRRPPPRRPAEQTEIRVVELRGLAVDIANNLVTGFPSPALKEALDTVATADGVIAVTPIFTASYSGLFKSFFDVLDNTALQGAPVLIAATGGTARHSLALEHALRPMFTYLRAVVVPTAVYAASEDWGATSGDGLAARVDRAAGELAALVARVPAKPRAVEQLIPFEQQPAALRPFTTG